MAMRVVGCMPLSLSFTVGRRSSRVCFAKGNNNHFVGSTRIGGKKFKIEIDSSIWREEIQNRNRLLDLAGRNRSRNSGLPQKTKAIPQQPAPATTLRSTYNIQLIHQCSKFGLKSFLSFRITFYFFLKVYLHR